MSGFSSPDVAKSRKALEPARRRAATTAVRRAGDVVEQRIDVSALTFDAQPIVESGPGRVVDSHVPLADPAGFVARVVEQSRPGHKLVAQRTAVGVVDDAGVSDA